jgi:hypothetical protein
MPSPKDILICAGLLIVVVVGWQAGARTLANIELKSDLHDLASQVGTRIGLSQPISDEDLRNAVIRKAKQYDLELNPNQVTIKRSGSGDKETLFLAVDYEAPIHLPLFSFHLHFTPTSGK